jgi:hypothetical protein
MALVAASGLAQATEIRGTYIESRNAEIYASHCFANSEMGLRGDLAVMAWKIDAGSFNNVALDGLGVVAVIKASNTLGDPFHSVYPAQAALIVDERATSQQREALTAFARKAAGRLLEDIVQTAAAPISLTFEGGIHDQRATMTAGDLAKITTRPIRATDSLCHLDDIYYGPLVSLEHAMPAFSTLTSFQGQGLGTRFTDHGRSSAYLGTFAMATNGLTD